jgi:hypothetical protein
MVAMPLSRVPSGELRRVVVPVLVVWLLAWLPFLLIGEPNEMVRLQLAGSESQAREIVAGWSQAEVVDMAILLGVDGVHVVSYGVLLATAAIWAGRQFRGRATGWAPALAWMAVAAAAFDIVENTGLIVMVRGEINAPMPRITTAFSLAKYGTVLVVASYAIAGLVARLRGPGR